MNFKKNLFTPRFALLGLLAVAVLLVVYNFTRRPSTTDIASTAFTQTASGEIRKTSIAIITAGLGKAYRNFAVTLFESAEKHYCKNKRDRYAIDYIMFSDDTTPTDPPARIVYKKKLGWPQDSENRFKYITDTRKELSLDSYDFLFWMDADMLFVNDTCEDILGQLVGSHHAWFPSPLKRTWPYESRNNSMAYVPQDNMYEQVYFHATFYGGESHEFLKMIELLKKYSDIDHANGIQAAVDDESYLNRYFYDNPPNVVLSMGFVWTKYVPVKTRKILIITRGKPPKE